MSRLLAQARDMDRAIAMVADSAGQNATIRRYVSGTGGTPWLGTAETRTYVDRRIRLVALRPANVQEVAESGGRIAAGDQLAFIHDQISVRDRVFVRGAEWQVASEPESSILNGQRGSNVILRRQAI